jgi:hypothetical protein
VHPVGVHPPDIEQQGRTLYISINNVLNAFQAASQGCGALLARQLESRRHLQQQGMHGVAQLVSCYGEEFVARLEELLEICDPRPQAGLGVRETAP